MISIIIPTYNRENTIRQSIESVLNQQIDDIEVIVIDDCSKDYTEKVVNHIHDSRIRYYRNKKNFGACYSRNLGIDLSNGEFIAFQDSDDKWLPGKLNAQKAFLENNKCDVVFCAMVRNIDNRRELYPPYKPDNNKDLFSQLLFENCISTQTIFGKSEVFKSEKFDERMPRFQDWEYALRLSKKSIVKYLDAVFVESFVQLNSISLNSNSALKALDLIYNKYKDKIQSDNSLNKEYQIKFAEYTLANRKNPKLFYKNALKLKFSIKILLFYLFCLLSLHKLLFSLKKVYFQLK